MSSKEKPLRIALFGAAPDTPNMGVSALFVSAVTGLSKHLGPAEFVVFDNGLGRRASTLRTSDGREIRLILYGARGGRRYYRPENLAAMTLASRLGRLGGVLSEGIRLIDSCDAVLDVSGGDSFSDIYGRERFENIYRPKAIARNRGKLLVLLPQTYGPYKSPAVRALAALAVQRCDVAWARDPDSFRGMQDLLGDCFDPQKHRSGVDMAFGLEAKPANEALSGKLRSWIEHPDPNVPLIGFNVSGLIYNSGDGGVSAFGLRNDYRETVDAVVRSLLDSSDARLVLVSHVMDRSGHPESDHAACLKLLDRLGDLYAPRIAVSPVQLDESQVKWLISKTDWFCGTRMHSTIASLSSGVATAAITYSDKARGVFEVCGQGTNALDPRQLDSRKISGRLNSLFHARMNDQKALQRTLPSVRKVLDAQFQSVAQRINVAGRRIVVCQ